MKQCRSCNGHHIEFAMHLDRVPRDVQRLVTKEQLAPDRPVPFDLYQCADCGLVQAPESLESTYYDDYLMSTTFSIQLQNYLDGLVDEIVTQYQLQDATVLDVGCGDGAFMLPFVKRNINVVGIEPSERSRESADQRGLTVYPGYVAPGVNIPGGPFTAFVSRQVLEHVTDISGFLTGIRENLAPGAIGIIEIPRLEKALEDNRFYDFFPDHVNYFTLDTLSTTLKLHGFEVLDLRKTMYDEYNVAVVQLRQPHKFDAIVQQRIDLVDQIETVFANSHAQGQRTAIWGSGAKGLSIMTAMNTDNLDLVVDSDPNKIGRYIPANQYCIHEPTELVSSNIDVVVISAIAYQTIIINKLRDMGYSGRVYLIDNLGLVEHCL